MGEVMARRLPSEAKNYLLGSHQRLRQYSRQAAAVELRVRRILRWCAWNDRIFAHCLAEHKCQPNDNPLSVSLLVTETVHLHRTSWDSQWPRMDIDIQSSKRKERIGGEEKGVIECFDCCIWGKIAWGCVTLAASCHASPQESFMMERKPMPWRVE